MSKEAREIPVLKTRFKIEEIKAYMILDELTGEYIETYGGKVAYLNKKDCIDSTNELTTLYFNTIIGQYELYNWLDLNRVRRKNKYVLVKDEIPPKQDYKRDIVKHQVKSEEIEKLKAIISHYLKGKWVDVKEGFSQTIDTALFNRKARIKIDIKLDE